VHLVDSGLSDEAFYRPYPGLWEGSTSSDGTEEGGRRQEMLAMARWCMARDPADRPSFRELARELRRFCDSLHPAAAASAARANAAALAEAEAGRQSAPREMVPGETSYGGLMRELVSLGYEDVCARLRGLSIEKEQKQCIFRHMLRLRTPEQREQWNEQAGQWKERQQEQARRRAEERQVEEERQMEEERQRAMQQTQWAEYQQEPQHVWEGDQAPQQPQHASLLVPTGWSTDDLLLMITHLMGLSVEERVSCMVGLNLSPQDLEIIAGHMDSLAPPGLAMEQPC